MVRWEYKIFRCISITESEMNALGRDGWELVSTDYHNSKYFFKRPIHSTTNTGPR